MSAPPVQVSSVTPTLQQFRDTMSKFSDSRRYPDNEAQMWLSVAIATLDKNRWADFWVMGIMQYVAHMLTLDDMARRNSGGGVGVVASKSLGPGSLGYDVNLGAEERAGQWNMTLYGRRYIYYARLVGMGGVQVSPLNAGGMGISGPGVII